MKPLSSVLTFFDGFRTLSHQEKSLTITNTALSLGQGMSLLFLNIYLWKQVGGIEEVVLFNLIQYPAILLIFLSVGMSRIKIQLRKLLGFGFISYTLGYILLILLGNNAASYIIPLGLLFGIATGVYWSANNALVYICTPQNTRDRYYGINSSIGYFMSVFTPLLAGIILNKTFLEINYGFGNYYLLFSIVISVFLFGSYYSLRLPKETVPSLGFKDTLEPFKSKVWRLVSLSAFVDGFKSGSAGFVVSILTYKILNEELNMALYSSTFSLISGIVSYKLAHKIKPHNRLKFGLFGAILFIFVHTAFIMEFSQKGLLLSNFIQVFANPLFNLGLASTFFLVIDSHPEYKKRYYKYIAFKEIPVAAGRLTGALLFLVFLGIGSELATAKLWYALLGFVPLVFFLLTYSFNKIVTKEMALEKA